MIKAIGLFGGTFDPVHKGHVSVAESYLKSGYIDELWMLLTPDPPHKKDRLLTPYNMRKKMLQAAFEDQEGVVICDIENSLSRPSYTVKTIRYLKGKYPEVKFYLCLGQDSLSNFKDWHKWREILNECELLAAERPDVETKAINQKIIDKTKFVEHIPVGISSTDLRNKLTSGESVQHLIPEKVGKVIKDHDLYTT